MAENVTRFREASALFALFVRKVQDWEAPTPCSEWNTRDLVNHLTNEVLWVPPLMAGETVAQVGDRFDGDLLGDDASAAYESAREQAMAVLNEPDALDRVVHLSYGDESAANYVDQLTVDALVHSWDLATAVGADNRLPDKLVRWALAGTEANQEMITGSGLFGPVLPYDEDANSQTQLLARMGRAG